MKDLIVGLAVGAVFGYIMRASQERCSVDHLNDNVNEFASKAKNKIKDAIDIGKNKVEYLKDRAEYELNKAYE